MLCPVWVKSVHDICHLFNKSSLHAGCNTNKNLSTQLSLQFHVRNDILEYFKFFTIANFFFGGCKWVGCDSAKVEVSPLRNAFSGRSKER